MSSSKKPGDAQAPYGKPGKRSSASIVLPRRGVLIVLGDAELGQRVADLASSAGLEATYAEGVAAALEAWNDRVAALLVDAGLAGEAVPLVRRASQADAVILAAGTPLDGEATLRLLAAGARIYVPLPESPERIARRLQEVVARETELRGESSLVELAKSELQAVFDTFPSPLVVIGSDLTVRRANRAVLLLSQRESFGEILGADPRDVFGWPEEEDAAIKEAVEAGREIECEFEALREWAVGPARRVFRCRVFSRGNPSAEGYSPPASRLTEGALALLEDITLSAREERERARREKLEAVALLAATLSHEINQPLGTILGRAQLAMLALDQPDAEGLDLRRDLKDIVASVQRITNILDRLHEVTDIVTKTYPGGGRILDLEQSVRLPERKGEK